MNPIRNAIALFAWVFFRLPLAFSIPFSAISIWWLLSGFGRLDGALGLPLTRALAHLIENQVPGSIGATLIANLGECIHALVVIALFMVGFVAAYNVSALLNWMVLKSNLKPHLRPVLDASVAPHSHDIASSIAGVRKIGIVLAGGGAKGAFQAGSMRAIYEHLARHNALDKVKVIAGTSIGSWNAMFWLADLIAADRNVASPHERWWSTISLKSLTAPLWYVPFCRNAFLSPEPWRRTFDRLFGSAEVRARLEKSSIHFYFTRSNVRSGQIHCTTNNPSPPAFAKISYDILDPSDPARDFLQGAKDGVFASMDLPPLFPYVAQGDNLFEDGGVIDNLPIIFAAGEDCDLIFILPINADFEEEPNQVSMAARLFRVMDVRQGALERNGFKLIYLFNELAALRQHIQKHAPDQNQNLSAPLQYALQRDNDPIRVCAICPAKSFVQSTLNTQELWKAREAHIAFNVMHQATVEMLSEFDFESIQPLIRVALVSRAGSITWDERF